MQKQFFSFDGTESVKAEYSQPADGAALREAIGERPFIPRGSGLSYCGAGMDPYAHIIQSAGFSGIIDFDSQNRTVKVGSALTIGELLVFLSKNNFWLGVIPGHPAITIGGCIGFNVHGKNQSVAGNFNSILTAFEIFHPDHGFVRCSRLENADIFDLTCGGFGLTGFVVWAELKVYPIDIANVVIKRVRTEIQHLKDAPVYLAHPSAHSYLYSWHDLNLPAKDFGRGYVFTESMATAKAIKADIKTKLTADSRRAAFPGSCIPVGLTNNIFRLKQAISPKVLFLPLMSATFPILGYEAYFYQFGKQGLREYQCIIPFHHWANFTNALEREIKQAGVPITLTSLKLFSGKSHNLNFLGEGICIALNVANSPKAILFFERLDRLVEEYNGVVNISKDSRLSSQAASKIFPFYNRFKEQINIYDPQKRVQSLLRRRLDI